MKKILLLATILLSSCGGSSTPEQSSVVANGLKGKFANEVELKVLHRNDVSTDDLYLYTSTYPLNTMTGFGCYESHEAGQEFRYYYSQTLTLQKDYTFHYVYDIIFGNPWNCPEMMSINVDVFGTYTFSKLNQNEYTVSLSSPESGTERFYGCNFSVNELWWFGGGITAKHQTPDKEVDFEMNKIIKKEEVDWYTRGREVKISFANDDNPVNLVTDDLFNSYYLDHVGQFCTY